VSIPVCRLISRFFSLLFFSTLLAYTSTLFYALKSFGFIVGLVLCSILMSVIGSAVNTVIVCFAEGPAEFQRNHPRLSEKMRAAWLQAYPGCI
jgi:uncharacterized membrane protein